MKKILTALLALALLALACGGLAEGASAMPAVGDVVNGFELIEVRDYSLIGGEIYRFTHQKTGAELFYIANSDTNRSFEIGFHTQPIDQTGLPHVFEHATLDGSDKYPSKALWFNLANGSYNTFMNAMTSLSSTVYPIASLSEAQLLKLADLYVDSCFHPMLMRDESIFREEAWRYRLGSPEDELTIEGTVYSEMLGARTLERVSLFNLLNLALPGAYCNNDSGGVPEYIPEMTYDALRSYHELYYHPSNSISYLYGKFDDYAAFLKLLDEAFSGYEAREFTFEEPGYTPISAPAEGVFDYSVEAGSDTQDASAVVYGIVCPGLRDCLEDTLAFDALINLMNDSASNITKAIEKQFPRAEFGFQFLDDGPDKLFMAVFYHVNPEDAPTLKGLVDDGLREIVENGFSQELIDATLSSLEISSRLTAEQSDLGVELSDALLSSYIATGDPWYNLEWEDALQQLGQWNQDGTYADLITTWLLDSPLTALATTRSVAGMKEEQDAALAERLAEIKAGMSDEEIAAIVETTNAEDEEDPGTDAMLAELTAVTVESLPEEVPDYPMTDETGEDGVRRVDVTAGVDGIGNAVVMFDPSGLPQEDLHWFKLYVELLGSMDTAEHDYQTLDNLISRYLYGFSAAIQGTPDAPELQLWMTLRWISLDEDLEAAYDLAREILLETSFEDTDRLRELVQGQTTNLKSTITGAPYSTLVRLGMGKAAPYYRLSSATTGLSHYEFLTELEAMLEEDPQAAVEKLQSIQQYFNNSANLILGYAGSEAGIALNRPLADAFAASLERREIVPCNYDLPATEAASEALIVDSAVQYNGLVLGLDALGMTGGYDARIEVVNALIEDLYLYPQLRDRYGAYGVGLRTIGDVGEYVYSYRDPTVTEAFEVYEGIPAFLEGLDVDQATIDRYILSCYTDYAKPTGELSGAVSKLTNHILGHETEEALAQMRALKSVTLDTFREFTDPFRSFVAEGYRFTGGGAAAINAHGELYDSILNPFGAVDRSQEALADVAEDSPYYEAVRFAYENGLMDAREDGSFGVAEPAAQGDLAVALMAVLGESAEAPEAVETLAGYGILDGETAPEDALTAAECEATLERFSAAIGLDYPGGLTAEADPFTRGDLAQALSDYLAWLDVQEPAA